LSSTGRILPQNKRNAGPSHVSSGAVAEQDDEEEDEEDEAVKVLEEQASFDEVVLWGHESMPDENDPYVKGIDEWISFAETVGFMLA